MRLTTGVLGKFDKFVPSKLVADDNALLRPVRKTEQPVNEARQVKGVGQDDGLVAGPGHGGDIVGDVDKDRRPDHASLNVGHSKVVHDVADVDDGPLKL